MWEAGRHHCCVIRRHALTALSGFSRRFVFQLYEFAYIEIPPHDEFDARVGLRVTNMQPSCFLAAASVDYVNTTALIYVRSLPGDLLEWTSYFCL
mmetsp:Transcript_25168/g.58648  ORF Transcript_25168/g.58648 Transcript_25168/m.58648 type:complete len:95 (+) Transcript_25168:279-563(+)